jgi:hypothetical protein
LKTVMTRHHNSKPLPCASLALTHAVTVAQLEALPPRAVVAFAARCARRVQPLAMVRLGRPTRSEPGRSAVMAIRCAEAFAAGKHVAPATFEAAEASFSMGGDETAEAVGAGRHAARSAAAFGRPAAFALAREGREAAAQAFVAAISAAVAAATRWTDPATAKVLAGRASHSMRVAAERDLQELTAYYFKGTPRHKAAGLGMPIDASEEGPLGPLWPEGGPDWYHEDADEPKAR